MNILFLGDIVGRPGRRAVKIFLPGIVDRYRVDLVIANAENVAGGVGCTPALLQELRWCGIQLFSLGNHAWRKQEMLDGIDALNDVARPANFPPGLPGKGTALYTLADGRTAALINLLGRVFMDPVDCPFIRAEIELDEAVRKTRTVVIDIHAEATSEKAALAHMLDGRCTAVIGTHTHVQTADACILPGGTAFISDVGMCGPVDSILGMEKERVLERLITGIPRKWEVAGGPVQFCALWVEADESTGRALRMERIYEREML